MKRFAIYALFMSMLWLSACERNQTSETSSAEPSSATSTPIEYVKGESLFNSKCAHCHGQVAKGTQQGPPLISKIYEPSHHGDASFHFAVRRGVQAHHWKFGNMPKIEGVTEQEVNEVIAYVRWLQRQIGIF